MGAYGLIMILNQAVLFKKVWLKLPSKTLLYISFIGFIICYLGAFFFPFKRAVIILI